MARARVIDTEAAFRHLEDDHGAAFDIVSGLVADLLATRAERDALAKARSLPLREAVERCEGCPGCEYPEACPLAPDLPADPVDSVLVVALPVARVATPNGPRGTPLPTSAFRPDDKVVGYDEGGTHIGKVSEHHGERGQGEDVLVYWVGERYDSSSLGNLVPAHMLRLWPFAAHEARCAEIAQAAPTALPAPCVTSGVCPHPLPVCSGGCAGDFGQPTALPDPNQGPVDTRAILCPKCGATCQWSIGVDARVGTAYCSNGPFASRIREIGDTVTCDFSGPVVRDGDGVRLSAVGPTCGMKCDNLATHVDGSGVGYCPEHAEDCVPVDEAHPFDPWWTAAGLAAEAGGEEAARWEGLEYGEWPDGSKS